MEQFVSLSEAQPLIPSLYFHFIKGKWDLRMNVFALTKIAIKASQQLLTREKSEGFGSLDEISWLSREHEITQNETEKSMDKDSLTPTSTGSEALDILLEIKSRLEMSIAGVGASSRSSGGAPSSFSQSLISAQVLLLAELAKHHLLDPGQPLNKIASLLNQAKLLLHSPSPNQQNSSIISSEIRAQLYRVMAGMDKATGAYDQFYEHTMLFLASQSHKDSSLDSSLSLFAPSVLADDLIIATLVSPTRFCVGEAMLQPLVVSHGTPALLNLLQSVSDGNLSSLKSIQPESSTSSTFALLGKKQELIVQKCKLMALITLASSSGTTLTFEQIKSVCTLESIVQVPALVIQAISKGLLKASISWSITNDSDNGIVKIQWTHPKIINNVQGLMYNVQGWREKVAKAIELLSVKQVGGEMKAFA